MSKRAAECDICGETLAAATDEELYRRVAYDADEA